MRSLLWISLVVLDIALDIVLEHHNVVLNFKSDVSLSFIFNFDIDMVSFCSRTKRKQNINSVYRLINRCLPDGMSYFKSYLLNGFHLVLLLSYYSTGGAGCWSGARPFWPGPKQLYPAAATHVWC